MKRNRTDTSIMKGAMILSIGVMLSKIIGLIYRIPIRQIIGDEGNGLYSSAYQVYKVILALTAIAMPAALSKLIAEREAVGAYKESERVYKVAFTCITTCALVFAILIGFGADFIADVFFPGENIALPIRSLAPTIVVATIIASLRGYFQGLNDMVPTASSQVIEQIVNVVMSVLLAYQFAKISLIGGVTGATLGTSLGALAALIMLGIIFIRRRQERKVLLKHSNPYKVESNREITKSILAIMVPIIISTSVFSIMTFIDLSMISKLLPNTLEVLQANNNLNAVPVPGAQYLDLPLITAKLKGQFGFQYNTFIEIPVSLVLQLAAASIPAIAAGMALKAHESTQRKIKMIFKIGLLIVAPSSVAFLIFGPAIIQLVLNDSTGGMLLSAGAIGLIFITLAQISAAILQGVSKAKISSMNAIIACVIKVGVNFVLISRPSLHIYGIIHSTTICYMIYAGLNLRYLKKYFDIHVQWKEVLLKPLMCAGIMGLISYIGYQIMLTIGISQRLAMLGTIPIAILIYGGTGLLTGTITLSDLKMLPGGKKVVAVIEKRISK